MCEVADSWRSFSRAFDPCGLGEEEEFRTQFLPDFTPILQNDQPPLSTVNILTSCTSAGRYVRLRRSWTLRRSSSGAREHNLRDVNLDLPRNQLIVFTGVSGSGKSSLAFDTLYAEGQRRYVESLSSYARQFLGQMPKPDVDYIGGLSPVDQDPAEDRRAEPALDRRHHHRDLRLPPRPLRPRRPGALPEVRPADHGPDARADRRAASSPCPTGTRFLRPGPGDPRPEGRVQGPVRRHAQARLRPRPRRRPGRAA